jgi:hypothetical protein
MLSRILNHVLRRSAITKAPNTFAAQIHSPLSSSIGPSSASQKESIQIILTQNPSNFFGNERAAARHIQELEHDITQLVNVIVLFCSVFNY